ncbi:MAG: GGDEF domain-containing protein [Oscillospiraceae bacterium]|nr:GGDEF domain-containing protein [Oscillospiraceae bacterium]
MRKFRKLIGVILSQSDEPYQARLLNGILEQAFKLNYDVAVFAAFMKSKLSEEWHSGELNIYSLINYSVLDGIIIASDTIVPAETAQEICSDIKKKFRKPVVSVDIYQEDFNNIFTDDKSNVKMIISHLIEEHQFTDIAFMTGIKGHPHATNRLTGYYEALVEHDIPIDQSRVFYGDFWYHKGEEVVQALLADTSRPLPQAIACASDTMAISVCEALKAHGIRVPEDVAVTGYDSIDEGLNYVPSITSSKLPSDNTGKRAMKLLHSLITGTEFTDEKCEPDICVYKSCGCKIDASEKMRTERGTWRSIDYTGSFNSVYNAMLEALISEKDFRKYMEAVSWYTYQLGDFSSFYLCLCENWDNLGETEQNPNYLKDGYSQTISLPIRIVNGNCNINPEVCFNSREMLPALYENRPRPAVFYFNPVHFNDRCFGYSVISYINKPVTYPECYNHWMRYISNSLESLRRQRNLKYMYDKMEENAITDLLTGIYNRNGFNLYANDILDSAKKSGGKLTLIMGDMNNLKYINDTFGHIEGDFAIKTAADAFRTACSEGMKCFRIGGDEYIIISEKVDSQAEIDRVKASIASYLKHINDTADKPYSVSVSLGVYFGEADSFENIEQPMAIADEEMFAAKEKYKKEDGFDYRKSRSAK